MRLPLLLAGLAFSAAAQPRLFYSKSFPGSAPAYCEIILERDGSGVYKEKPDDDQPVKFRMKQEEADTLFTLAEMLERFRKPLESGLPVARMGEKTLRWENGAERFEQKFNYSTDTNVQTLHDWFERITETEQRLFMLESTARFDKLGVDRALLLLEAAWDKKRLVATHQFEPWLNRIIKNDAYLNMARERASRVLEMFRAGPAPAAN
jgi:hypothetical protein